jgi:hypothetical protein
MSKKSKNGLTYYDRCVRAIFEDLSEKLGALVDLQKCIANGDSNEKYDTSSRGRVLASKKRKEEVPV